MSTKTDSTVWTLVDSLKLEFKSGFLQKYGVNALITLCNKRDDKKIKLALSDDGDTTKLEFFTRK